MATRASVVFTNNGKSLFAMYKHYDGYPESLGRQLKEIVSGGKIVNGLGRDRNLGSQFNGYGCLFATVIAKLKQEPGDVYICEVEAVGKQGEDYVYEMDETGELTYRKI